MTSISDAFFRMELAEPGWVLDLRSTKSLWIAVDIAGGPADPFQVYSFLITAEDVLGPWGAVRERLRRDLLPDGRRLSYKAMGDKIKLRALPHFLQASG